MVHVLQKHTRIVAFVIRPLAGDTRCESSFIALHDGVKVKRKLERFKVTHFSKRKFPAYMKILQQKIIRLFEKGVCRNIKNLNDS